MRVIGPWIVDFGQQVAFAKTRSGLYVRRTCDGQIELLKELPLYVQQYLNQLDQQSA